MIEESLASLELGRPAQVYMQSGMSSTSGEDFIRHGSISLTLTVIILSRLFGKEWNGGVNLTYPRVEMPDTGRERLDDLSITNECSQ